MPSILRIIILYSWMKLKMKFKVTNYISSLLSNVSYSKKLLIITTYYSMTWPISLNVMTLFHITRSLIITSPYIPSLFLYPIAYLGNISYFLYLFSSPYLLSLPPATSITHVLGSPINCYLERILVLQCAHVLPVAHFCSSCGWGLSRESHHRHLIKSCVGFQGKLESICEGEQGAVCVKGFGLVPGANWK